MKYQSKEERQVNRLPRIPIWDNWSMASSFLWGLVIGIIIGIVF